MMANGVDVEVRSSFDRSWVRGFQIVEVLTQPIRGYRLRRRSDGFILPRLFAAQEVRPTPRRPPVSRRPLLV